MAPPRPQFADARDAAVLALAPEVLRWLNDPNATYADVVRDLGKAMHGSGCDGYEIALQLDLMGWAPDQALVAILARAFERQIAAHEAAVRSWVAAHDVRLDLEVGRRVRVGLGKEGPIAALRLATAQYVVALTEEQRASPGSGACVAAEDCEPVAEVAIG